MEDLFAPTKKVFPYQDLDELLQKRSLEVSSAALKDYILEETKGCSFEVELTWVYGFLCGIESCELFRGFWQMEWTGHKVLNTFLWNISWCAGS
jgi:hypothetical protein